MTERIRFKLTVSEAEGVTEEFYFARNEVAVMRYVWDRFIDMQVVREVFLDIDSGTMLYMNSENEVAFQGRLKSGAPLTDQDVILLWSHYKTGGKGTQYGIPHHEWSTAEITLYHEPEFTLI